jgi:hypothetical protein
MAVIFAVASAEVGNRAAEERSGFSASSTPTQFFRNSRPRLESRLRLRALEDKP